MLTSLYKKGYTLIELIIYLSILSIFFFVIVNSLLSFSGPYRQIVMKRNLERSGLNSMEKIAREIRSATSVDISNSTFLVSPGALTLLSGVGVVSTTTKFYVQNNILKMDVNGSYFGPLTNSTTTVNNLVFTLISNTNSSGVKVDLTLQTTFGSMTESKTFHTTVILKGLSG